MSIRLLSGGLLGGAVVATGLLVAPPAPASGGEDKAEAKARESPYYPLKVGTKWYFQRQTDDGEKWQVVSKIEKIEDLDGQACARIETFGKPKLCEGGPLSLS